MQDISSDTITQTFGNVYSVLLAGGSGTRLWPVSRELYPKQLVKFIGNDSLVQLTIKRLKPLLDTENIRIICGQEHLHEIAKHMKGIGIDPEGKILCEPCGRNTAPAILFSLLNILKGEGDPILCIFPADHVINDVEDFQDKLKSGIKLADLGYIVTFGITPHYPETGYGYVEGDEAVSDGAFKIKRFIEKPEIESAKKYVEAGNFFWNSGMFAFKASVILEEFKTYQPDLFSKMDQVVSTSSGFPDKEAYEQLPDISIDYAIMEKTKAGVVLPSTFGWSDIGSWKSLYDFLPKDGNNNVIDGDVIAKNTKNSFIMGHKRLIATNYVDNMIIVETPDSVFVSDIDNSRDVKSIVEKLREKGREEYQKHRKVHYSWGSFTTLEQKDGYEIARLVIYPGSVFEVRSDDADLRRLDILKGTAEILINDQKILLAQGESTTITGDKRATVKNSGDSDLSLVEIHIKS